MFDKYKFAQILKNITETYDSQRDFSKKSEINRTYLSQYMNTKLEEPPKPKILEKLANSSNGVISYEELMQICGYIYLTKLTKDTYTFVEVSEYEWNLIFGKTNVVELNTNEATIWSEIINNLHSNNHTINYNIDNYLKKCNNKNEKNVVTQLYYFFMLLLIKFTNNTEDYNEFIKDIKKRKICSLSNNEENQFYMCPVYGQISAGQPNWAEECIEGRIPIDPVLFNIVDPEEHFFLRVNGESMNKVVNNGGYALIHKQDIVDEGEIAVVLVNGDEATLKKFDRQGDFILLEPMSNDSSFKTQIYDKSTPIKILGKYIGKFEMNK